MRRRLLVPLTFAAFAAAAPVPAHAAPKSKSKAPTVKLAAPKGTLTVGKSVKVTVQAKAAKGRKLSKFTLSYGDGSKTVKGTKPKRSYAHAYRKAGSFTFKVTVTDNRRKSRTAKLKVKITAARSTVTPVAQAPHAPPSAPPTPQPAPPAPLDLEAAPVELVTGSTVLIALPEPLQSVARLTSAQGAPAAVSVTNPQGALSISAATSSTVQSFTVAVTGVGCTYERCGHPLTLTVPVTVRALKAPQRELERFTSASQDRVAAALPIDGIPGASELRDEVVLVLGTPDNPGTRELADALAELVGGVISGGIDSAGLFELRWTTPQDLAQRRAELLAQAGVTEVSTTKLGLISTNAEPSDWDDDGIHVKWPFNFTRAQQAWDNSKGSDVKVGIVDGGQVFGAHEDLDVVKKIGSNPAGYHATHVAGTACARANGTGLVGFAWGCQIVTSGWNDRSPKGVSEAIKSVVKAGAKVVNMSLGYGGSCETAQSQQYWLNLADQDKEMFRQLFRGDARDVIFTVSAGNTCAGGVASPWGRNSDLGNVISVAAINSDRKLARFSSFGSGVEVAAPGGLYVEAAGIPSTVGIWSTLFEHCRLDLFLCASYGYKDENSDLYVGTSMAAPAVAGIAALVRSAHSSFGASRAAGCITGTAGTGGVGTITERSPEPSDDHPSVAFSGSIPIVNAQQAVLCQASQFSAGPGTGPRRRRSAGSP